MNTSRRGFLSTGAGLIVGFYLPSRSRAAEAPARVGAWVRVGADESITLMIHKTELGQGTVTALSQLLAEELECDWKKVRTEFPPVDRAYGGNQGVVGSASIRSSYDSLRKAGAAAREMLATAAASQWNVDRAACKADNGYIVNSSSGARLSYGQLAVAASTLQPPPNPVLKDPKQFRLIGKSVKRLDTPDKISGKTTFGIDVRVPGMVYAAVARSPVFGGKVVSFDATKAKALPGVKNCVQISSGVAVIADNTWTAIEAAKLLDIKWDEGENAKFSSPGIRTLFRDKLQQPGMVARKTGDGEAALTGNSAKIEAVYEAPFLAHAPMEPLNCVAHVRVDGCDVWASTQMQSAVQSAAMKVTGFGADKIQVHTYYAGGGFGRRARADFAQEAVEIAKFTGVPVKVTWSREDDLRHGFFRPAAMARFTATLDSGGYPAVLTSRIASPSIAFGGNGNPPRNGLDGTSTEGISDLKYDIPHMQVEYHWTEAGAPASYWRAVGYTQNTFFAESFIDELAVAGKKDPLALRRKMLAKNARMLNVLELAADKAGWGKPLPAGHHHGIAVVNNVGSFTAQVAEVSIANGKVKVHRVVCATDCGQVVNPAIVEQQIRSAIVFGLSAALKGEITLLNGRVEQSNFHQYDMLRIDETPHVEVHIVDSAAASGGMGEAGVPTIAPAVCNAIFAATGKRIRRLPIRPQDLA